MSLHLIQRAEDYARMESALEWLGARWRERPSLEEAAAAAGLSPHHFQRVFTRWAGVSPKSFMAALAHAEARRSLGEGANLLDAAWDAGLSGPSRLHDLFIAHEAVTPGEVRRRGEGLVLKFGFVPSPFGEALVVIAPRGLAGLAFTRAGETREETFDDMFRRWPAADWTLDEEAALAMARRAFGEGERPDLVLMGAPFQIQVWKALLKIAPGDTLSYGQVASLAGKPGAARATGAAIGANPISLLIPCHRAIAADGRLTGYHWGLGKKIAMLGEEAVRRYGGAAA